MPASSSCISESRSLQFGPNGYRNDAYDELALGRAPTRKRKSGGLDARLGRMLHYMNTSLVGDPSNLLGRRPRNPSSSSSSSTIAPDVQQTSIDAIHKTVKSDSLGEEFSVIKPARSRDRSRSAFFANENLQSWRDAGDGSNADQIRELPDWLSTTFSTLEASHPLRALALSKETGTVPHRSVLPDTSTPAPFQSLEESDNNAIFSFTPPPHSVLDTDGDRFGTPPSEIFSYESASDSTTSHVLNDGLTRQNHPSIDDLIGRDSQNRIREFTPFAEPGPFAHKSVHFLTPVRSSTPITSIPHAQVLLNLHDTDRQEPDSFLCNPFSTPGPAASFSLPFLERGVTSTGDVEDDFSDPLTLADEPLTEDSFLAPTFPDESFSSILSFAPPVDLREKPFSYPGPTFPTMSTRNVESPPKPLLPSAHVSSPVQCGKPLDGSQDESQKMMHFIAKEHERMAKALDRLTTMPDLSSIRRKHRFGSDDQKESVELDHKSSSNTFDAGDDSLNPTEDFSSASCAMEGTVYAPTTPPARCKRPGGSENAAFRSSRSVSPVIVSQKAFKPYHMPVESRPSLIPALGHEIQGEII